MARGSGWIGVGLIGLVGLAVAGCASADSAALPIQKQSMAADIPPLGSPRLSRAQRPEGNVTLSRPVSAPPTVAAPPAPPGTPADSGTQQTSLVTRGNVRVNVRAWVNGKPIFDDELAQMGGAEMIRLRGLPEPQRSEKMTELFNRLLDQIIDQELMYQDAVKKLEKANPRALDQLKEYVDGEFDKQLSRMREGGVPEEQIKELEPVARRMLERSLIATEYARNRIMPQIKGVVNLETIQEYYEAHKNEFQTVDKVKWQNVFIAVGPKHQTLADARRFAEGLLGRCQNPADFEKLMEYDEGDSKLRGGEGFGQRKGEIRPAEVEEILFRLKDGEIGPVVEIPTGVHLMRLVKREYAGQLPLDDATQKLIRRKLENQLAEREYKRIVRELKSRAVWQIENEG